MHAPRTELLSQTRINEKVYSIGTNYPTVQKLNHDQEQCVIRQ